MPAKNKTRASKTASKRKRILLTGSAGFIGFHAAMFFLERGDEVIGLDSFTPYNDPQIKERRNAILEKHKLFKSYRASVADYAALNKIISEHKPDLIIHLAAQAGVRYSLKNPWAYADSNYVGTLNIFEAAKAHGIKKVIYASSSSVYGANTKIPFAESDRTDSPISTYAASKKANELLAYSYAHLYGMDMIGLRFFTVYGDFYRLDMALFKFAKSISLGTPIKLHGKGEMKREFTHVDDIVRGIAAAADKDLKGNRIYNLGGGKTIRLARFLELIEKNLGKKAAIEHVPVQSGELVATIADIKLAQKDLGFSPRVSIEEGIARFTRWFKENQAWLLKLKDADQ